MPYAWDNHLHSTYSRSTGISQVFGIQGRTLHILATLTPIGLTGDSNITKKVMVRILDCHQTELQPRLEKPVVT
jgi:hypothetical protein